MLCFISFRKSVKWRDRTSLVIVFKSNAKKFLVFTPILYKPNLKARKHRVSPIYSLLMRTLAMRDLHVVFPSLNLAGCANSSFSC